MDRLHLECSALGFQSVLTLLLALVYLGLWRQQRRGYFLAWAAGWGVYGLRLAAISAYLVERRPIWLFAHQAATAITAMLLLLAALQFTGRLRWRKRYLGFLAVALGWAYLAIYGIGNMMVAGISGVVLLSGVTLGTGILFWRRREPGHSTGATVLAWTFTLWGLHHLDYPLLRPLGAGVLYGVMADVLFITSSAIGMLFLALSEGRRALEVRTAQLEQLTRQLMRAQEDERRRIARELHDEAGQVLTAVKIELDLDGRREASELVARALSQVRNLSNLLRPAVLDDLGLVPAIHGLVQDFSLRTRIEAAVDLPDSAPAFAPDAQVVIYRVVQEALTNVARHARASRVDVRLRVEDGGLARVTVQDDGLGTEGAPEPHLGLLGMRERVTALGGSLEVGGEPGAGFRIEAVLPAGVAA